MRVAAISHSCVVDVNQSVYAEMEGTGDIELLLVVPKRWHGALEGDVDFARLEGLRATVAALPVRRSGSLAAHAYRGLERALREFRPDVIYADEEPHSVTAYHAARIARRLGARFVFSTKQNILRRYPWPVCKIERFVHSVANAAIVVNQEVANALRAKGYRGCVFVIPHGVDPALFHPGRGAAVRASLATGGPVVGYVGRLAMEKGVFDLLAAARQTWEHQRDFKLTFIGDGPVADRLEEQAAAVPEGRCEIVRAVAHRDVPDYIGALDLLVLPSHTTPTWKEQFGRVIVEALACGVPVLGSDSGHIPHLIETMSGGMIFREGEVGDLAEKLEALLGDEAMRTAMAQRGRERVLERYSNERIGQALRDAIRAAAA